jgi:hypothetical protein
MVAITVSLWSVLPYGPEPWYVTVLGVDEGIVQLNKLKTNKYMCPLPHNSSIAVERIAMLHVLDGSRHIDRTINKGVFADITIYAETRLEYMLEYYFPHVGFPDVWLFTLPFHYESNRGEVVLTKWELICYTCYRCLTCICQSPKTLFVSTPTIYLTSPLVCTWHSDGGHMVHIYYAKMARYTLESLCAGS